MISSLIIVLELGLLSLLLLLVFRMLQLNRREPLVPAAMTSELQGHTDPLAHQGRGRATRHPGKGELIPRLHILASLQMRDCRLQGLELETAHRTIRDYAVCWLYGAACALTAPGERNSDALAVLVSRFASRKLGIRQPDALAVIANLTRDAASLGCFRIGIEGAEFWQSKRFVPRELSLFEAAVSNTLV